MKKIVFSGLIFASSSVCLAQTPNAVGTDSLREQEISGGTITARRSGTNRLGGALNGMRINREELFRAACCNLGESFTTNPSVDVNYSDATTGAKQIRLLGLSGTYVQMLTENFPNYRGAAAPYALDYVPGTWMKSIQVSKGSSSVRNGFESITGQIDVEFLKPDDDEGASLNLYTSSMADVETNAEANVRMGESLSTELLAHYGNYLGHHDKNNDTFQDQAGVRQVHLQNRWKLKRDHYLFHAGIALVDEKREGGQNHHTAPHAAQLFKTNIETDRYEGYMKHAFILDDRHGTNIALMTTASMHRTDALFGHKQYYVNQKNVYAQLLFETHPSELHEISAGASFNHDYFHQRLTNVPLTAENEKETTGGLYAQYTLNLHEWLIFMAGLRADRSSLYGNFLTPRFHLKISPSDVMTLRLSAGKGFRSPHALAENHYLLASGRTFQIGNLRQESAWNIGTNLSLNIPLAGRTMKVNAEYYYTRFHNQAVIDYDSSPTLLIIDNLQGKSFSHTFQVDASSEIFEGFELTAAYRRNNVKCTYGGVLREKPLTSKHKALFSLDYKTPLGLWQFDITLQLNGGGRMPRPYLTSTGENSWQERFSGYEQLSFQVTRWFRHFSIYAGGENLTGFRQKQTIWGQEDVWGSHFEPTMIWGPVHGTKFYAGIRLNFGQH